MNKGVILVYSTYDAFYLEKEFNKQDIPVKLVPPPRQLSSECGFCIEFIWDYKQDIEDIINSLEIEIQGVYNL